MDLSLKSPPNSLFTVVKSHQRIAITKTETSFVPQFPLPFALPDGTYLVATPTGLNSAYLSGTLVVPNGVDTHGIINDIISTCQQYRDNLPTHIPLPRISRSSFLSVLPSTTVGALQEKALLPNPIVPQMQRVIFDHTRPLPLATLPVPTVLRMQHREDHNTFRIKYLAPFIALPLLFNVIRPLSWLQNLSTSMRPLQVGNDPIILRFAAKILSTQQAARFHYLRLASAPVLEAAIVSCVLAKTWIHQSRQIPNTIEMSHAVVGDIKVVTQDEYQAQYNRLYGTPSEISLPSQSGHSEAAETTLNERERGRQHIASQHASIRQGLLKLDIPPPSASTPTESSPSPSTPPPSSPSASWISSAMNYLGRTTPEPTQQSIAQTEAQTEPPSQLPPLPPVDDTLVNIPSPDDGMAAASLLHASDVPNSPETLPNPQIEPMSQNETRLSPPSPPTTTSTSTSASALLPLKRVVDAILGVWKVDLTAIWPDALQASDDAKHETPTLNLAMESLTASTTSPTRTIAARAVYYELLIMAFAGAAIASLRGYTASPTSLRFNTVPARVLQVFKRTVPQQSSFHQRTVAPVFNAEGTPEAISSAVGLPSVVNQVARQGYASVASIFKDHRDTMLSLVRVAAMISALYPANLNAFHTRPKLHTNNADGTPAHSILTHPDDGITSLSTLGFIIILTALGQRLLSDLSIQSLFSTRAFLQLRSDAIAAGQKLNINTLDVLVRSRIFPTASMALAASRPARHSAILLMSTFLSVALIKETHEFIIGNNNGPKPYHESVWREWVNAPTASPDVAPLLLALRREGAVSLFNDYYKRKTQLVAEKNQQEADKYGEVKLKNNQGVDLTADELLILRQGPQLSELEAPDEVPVVVLQVRKLPPVEKKRSSTTRPWTAKVQEWFNSIWTGGGGGGGED